MPGSILNLSKPHTHTHTHTHTGEPYTALDVAAFAREGQKPNGSSTEAVIQDFIVQGLTVDQLFSMLHKMRHLAGMKTLQEHGRQQSSHRGTPVILIQSC